MSYDIPDGYVTPAEAVTQLGVCKKTLERWRQQGKIKYIKPGVRKHFYYIKDYFEDDTKKENFIYCRVSTRGQSKDLDSQARYLRERYPNHTEIRDIGSGLNFKRKGLQLLLDRANKGLIGEVVVAHKDRLCRFGFEYMQWIIENSGGKLVVLDDATTSPQEELVNDLISIITVFSARIHGLRSYSNKIKKNKAVLITESEDDN